MSEDDWEPDLESEKEPPGSMMMNHTGKSMEQLVAWAVMTPRMRKTGRQEANLISTQLPTTCG